MSTEQFEKLSALNDFADLEAVDTKVGQGLKNFPRTLSGLQKSWQLLQKELHEMGSAMIWNHLATKSEQIEKVDQDSKSNLEWNPTYCSDNDEYCDSTPWKVESEKTE